MRYRGRHIDPVSLWENYVEFPSNMKVDENDVYFPKVVCPNPTHDTMKRHFQINARDGLVHCFASCGISGTFDKAISIIEGCNEREARKIILKHQRSGKSIRPRKKNVGASRSTTPISPKLLRYDTFVPQSGYEYLQSRRISADSIAEWRIGWDADEKRIVIPAADENGHDRFLIKRAVFERQNPKYLYYPEKETTGWGKTDVLFGACGIDLGMIQSVGLALVEGSLDVINLSELDLRIAGGILGTGISEQQRRIIARINPPRIYLMFDKDTAGITNIIKATNMLRKYPLFVCRWPKGGATDPGEIRTQKEALRIIKRAVPAFRFLADSGLSPNVIRPKGAISLG